MKNTSNRSLMLTAVALTLGAAAVYGQGKTVANIPFEFRAGGGSQPAGVYNVTSISITEGTLLLRNEATRNGVLLGIGRPEGGASGGDRRPRLVFRCEEAGGCVLSEVWGDDGRGRSYPAPHAKTPGFVKVAVVYLSRQSS